MMKLMIPIILLPMVNSRHNWPLLTAAILILAPASLALLPTYSTNSLSPSLSTSHLSTILITLSLWLTSLMLLASYPISQNNNNPTLFMTLLSFLLTMLLLSFSANSLIKFYIAFESTLIPTAALIMRWGYQPERIAASLYMLMYTLTASLPLLISLMMLSLSQSSLSIILETMSPPLTSKLSLFLILAFLVKLPMYTLHQWLPKAHVEAPVAGSMILAGVLLKLGAFGMFLVFHNNPHLLTLKHILIPLSLLGALTTALLCLRQSDMKALIAYASVSHMSLMLAAIMSQSSLAWQGSAIMLIAHGLTSSGLFASVNTIYESFNTRNLLLIKAILAYSPIMAASWFFLIMSNMATPPFINLPAEMFIITSLSSTFTPSIISILAALIIFTSSYSLGLFTSSSHGAPQAMLNPILINSPRTHLTALSHLSPLFIMILVLPILSI